MPDDFYIGYVRTAPVALALWIRRVTIAIAAFALTLAVVLTLAQHPFPRASFEFGVRKSFEGSIQAKPWPMLRADGAEYLLVAPGKHGAASAAAPFDGAGVHLEGLHIEREGHRMIEVIPGSIRLLPVRASTRPAPERAGPVDLMGEIIDTKCWLGVMNPGAGKVHRDCAARCISGGIPPALLVRDAIGRAAFFLLAGQNGEPLDRAVLPYVGEPAEVGGILYRDGKSLVLYAESIRHTRKQ